MKNERWSGLAVLAGILCAAAAVQAQGKPADPSPAASVVGESIDVRVVDVEVVVTDRWGKRVTGLTPGDFRLKVDGKPADVEYFTEVRDGRAVAPAAASGAAAEALPGVEPGAPIGTNYLVFVDGLFSIANQRDSVLGGIKRELDRLRPGDSMSIVTWDGGRLVRLAGWTGSREELARALDAAMRMPSHGLERRVELERLLDTQRTFNFFAENPEAEDVLARVLGPTPGLSSVEIDYGRSLGDQIAGASRAVISAMRGSSAPAGRKVLLLLSGGWPFSLESYIRGADPLSLAHELPENQVAFAELAGAANLLGYTIYPIDVPGLTTVVGDIRDNPRPPVEVGGAGTNPMLQPAETPMPAQYTRIDSFREQEVEGSLYFLAKETGGKPLLNGNRDIALAGAGSDTRSYYWLGFSPAWQRDGKDHQVSVEVLRKGLRARSRRGFRDLTRGAEADMKVEAALLFGQLPDSEPLELRLGAPVPGKERGVTEIPLDLAIPAGAVTVMPSGTGKGYAAVAQLRLAAMDDKGNQSNLPIIRLRLTADQQPAAGDKLRYETRIYLHGRADQLVAAVYDPLTGKVAAGRVGIQGP